MSNKIHPMDRAWELAEELYPPPSQSVKDWKRNIVDMQHAVAGISIFLVLDDNHPDCPPDLLGLPYDRREDLAVAYAVRCALETEELILRRGYLGIRDGANHSS